MAKVTSKFHETTPQQRRKMIRDLAKRVDIDESLEELIAALRKFEDKYGMSTVEFYARFAVGKMGDSADFVDWAGDFMSSQRLVQKQEKRCHLHPGDGDERGDRSAARARARLC